ncbi:unnamed protein product [Ascophyllum nodosum]
MNTKFLATCSLQRPGEALAIAAAATTSARPARLPSAVPQVTTTMAGTPTSSQVAGGADTVVPAAGGAEIPTVASGNSGAVPASLLDRAGAEWGGQQPGSAPPRISSHEGTRRGQGADALLRLSGSIDVAQQNDESTDEPEGENPIVAAYDHVTAITEHSARTRPIDAEVLGPRKQLLKTANATWSRFLAQAQAPVPRLGDGAGAGLGTLVQFLSPGLRSAGSPGPASDAAQKPEVTSARAHLKPSTPASVQPGTATALLLRTPTAAVQVDRSSGRRRVRSVPCCPRALRREAGIIVARFASRWGRVPGRRRRRVRSKRGATRPRGKLCGNSVGVVVNGQEGV